LNEIRDYYLDRLASPHYLASRREKAEVIAAVFAAELARARRALDLGCGSNLIARHLAERYPAARFVGVDREAAVVRHRDGVVLGDLEALPFADGAFDVAIANHSYEHTPHPARLFAEARRVVAPGGTIYCAAGNRWALIEPHYRLPFLSWLPRPLASTYVRLSGRGAGYEGVRFLGYDDLNDTIRGAGLVVEDRTLSAALEVGRKSPRTAIRVGASLLAWMPRSPAAWLLRHASPQWFLVLHRPQAGDAAPPPAPRRPRNAALLVALVVLGFLVRSALKQWHALAAEPWSLSLPWLAAASAGYATYLLALAANYGVVLARLGHRITLRRMVPVYLASALTRYVPGKVWPLASRTYLCEREGVPPIRSALALAVETLMNLGGAAVLALAALAAMPSSDLGRWAPVPVVVLVAVVLLVASPRVLDRAAGFILRRLGREAEPLGLSSRDLTGLLNRYLLVWLLCGASFAAFVRAVAPVGLAAAPALAGAFALAWAAGTVSFLPAGLGVRELTLAVLLAPTLGILATPVALASRLWLTAVEAVVALAVVRRRDLG